MVMLLWAVLSAGAPRSVISAQSELNGALTCEAAGDLPAARMHLEAAIKASPTWGLAEIELADVLMRQGEEGPALAQALTRAQSLDPGNPRLWRLVGAWKEGKEDSPGAIEAYQKALQIRGDDPRTHFQLAGLLKDAGKPEAAIAEYQTVIRLDPQDRAAHLALSDLFAGEGALASAESELRALVGMDPGNALYHSRLDDILRQEGKGPPPQRKGKGRKQSSDDPANRKLRPLLPSKS